MRRVVLSLAVLCASLPAHAQNVASTPASACVPSDVAIKGEMFVTGVANLRFTDGVTGQFTAFCPLARFNNGTTSWNLRLTYQDSTGAATGGQVMAQIYQMPLGASAPVLLATANSNTSSATGANTVASPTFNHTFDFETTNYWIRFSLKRDATNQTVFAHAAWIDGTAF